MKIVIVDDTPLNLLLMVKLVDRLPGVESHGFESPQEALTWCAHTEPDLIIVDYMMPDIDGLEFIRRVRASHKHEDVPILMVTANNERGVRYEALECGANDFLTKPIDAHEFEPRVRNMLKLREAHLATRQRAETLSVAVRKATAAHLATCQPADVVVHPLAGQSASITTYLLRTEGGMTEPLQRFIERAERVCHQDASTSRAI